MDITFGPVPSRRLGRSLGINNIPPKHCSYSCVYCQVGTTHGTEIRPRPFYSPTEILRQVEQRLAALRAKDEAVDWLTFVPDGEPTLDSRLGETIDGLRGLGLPIAVISNASLIWLEEVRATLSRADWVSVKVDSTDESIWRRINRPNPGLELDRILDGIRAFARDGSGTLVSETMLVAGANDSQAGIDDLGGYLVDSGISRAYLAVPTRPPAIASVHGPDEAVLTRAHQQLEDRDIAVELLTGHEGADFACVGDFGREVLAITSVHPMRESALHALAAKARSDMSVVSGLLDSGQLRRVHHQGEAFYIRRLHQD